MSISTPRQKRTSKRQRDILNASLHCFLEHGIEAATIEQIRDASGASSGSIYHHFGSKQAIAVALYAEGMEDLNRRFGEAMSSHSSLKPGIAAILRAYFQWVAENRSLAHYLLQVATADLSGTEATSIDEINRYAREDLSNWLKPFAERGEIVTVPDALYASLIYGASTHFVRHWLAGRIDLDLASAAQYLSEAAHITLARGENSRGVE